MFNKLVKSIKYNNTTEHLIKNKSSNIFEKKIVTENYMEKILHRIPHGKMFKNLLTYNIPTESFFYLKILVPGSDDYENKGSGTGFCFIFFIFF